VAGVRPAFGETLIGQGSQNCAVSTAEPRRNRAASRRSGGRGGPRARFARSARRLSTAVAVALGLIVAVLSGLRLLCARDVAPSGATPLDMWCAWLPCAGHDCREMALRVRDGDALQPDSSPPSEFLVKSPAAAQRWLRMAHFLLIENKPQKALYCVERSVALAPHSPPVLLEAAAFFHATGHGSQGLELMSRVLAATRDYDDLIFSLYRRAADVATVLRQGLPREPSAARAYFLHLLEERDLDGARLAWDWLSRSSFADRAVVRRYLFALIEDGRYDEAAAVFQNLLPTEERPFGGNRIVHGGFEAESSGAPLDWVLTPVPHAEARRDDSSVWEGSWSLRIEFDGEANVEYRHVAQRAILWPGRWKLQAWIRTDNLTSDQGVGLRIFEARPAPDWQLWTESVSGNSGWRLLEATVTVPPRVRLVQIEIVRRSSRKLDCKIGGVAWIDAVSLTPSTLETPLAGPS